MSDNHIIQHLRDVLTPDPTQLVHVGFHDSSASNTAFYEHDFIVTVLNELERRVLASVALDMPITPLERLAIELLMSSAFVSSASDIRRIAEFHQTRAIEDQL